MKKVLSRVFDATLISGKSLFTLCLICSAWMFVSCSNDDNDTPTPEPFDASKYALTDLHLHLDGSLSIDDAIYMASVEGVEIPSDKNELKKLLVCPDDCESLNDYLKCFDLPVSIMQSRETIAYSVSSLVKRLYAQGLIYAEIRYAPQLHLQKGMTQDEVVAASIDGLNTGLAACSGGIKAQLILCCMRGADNDELNNETIRMAKKYLGQGVCAADLAGAEALFPTSKYKALFAYAKEQGVPFTIHAGEADGVESMRLAIDYGAQRIGHGIRSWDDNDMKTLLKQKDVCLTLCPSSNLQTKAVAGITTMSQYPLQAFLTAGVPVCINTDNMTVSNTTVAQELQKLYDAGILTKEQAQLMVRNAINHAFLSDTEKEQLLQLAERRMK